MFSYLDSLNEVEKLPKSEKFNYILAKFGIEGKDRVFFENAPKSEVLKFLSKIYSLFHKSFGFGNKHDISKEDLSKNFSREHLPFLSKFHSIMTSKSKNFFELILCKCLLCY